ncbi:MAG TPA: DUF4190 domain-containing protein [Micromonosporaceae bacterium]
MYGQPATGKNGLATAGLIFGILPGAVIGIILSVLGLVRAKKLGGTGRARAMVGLVLSVLWTIGLIAGAAIIVIGGSSTLGNQSGCADYKKFAATLQTKLDTDGASGNLTVLKSDLQTAIDELNKDAGNAPSAAAKAMRTESADASELLKDLNSNTPPSASLQAKLQTDDQAIATACS